MSLLKEVFILERRRAKRIIVTAAAKWRRVGKTLEHIPSHIAVTKDISSRGVCISCYTSLIKGDIVLVEVKLPLDQAIHFKGEVMWVSQLENEVKTTTHKYDAGIKIIDMKTADLEILTKFTFTHFFQSKELI